MFKKSFIVLLASLAVSEAGRNKKAGKVDASHSATARVPLPSELPMDSWAQCQRCQTWRITGRLLSAEESFHCRDIHQSCEMGKPAPRKKSVAKRQFVGAESAGSGNKIRITFTPLSGVPLEATAAAPLVEAAAIEAPAAVAVAPLAAVATEVQVGGDDDPETMGFLQAFFDELAADLDKGINPW